MKKYYKNDIAFYTPYHHKCHAIFKCKSIIETVYNTTCGACAVDRVCNAGNGTAIGGGMVTTADCGAGQTVIIEVLEFRAL